MSVQPTTRVVPQKQKQKRTLRSKILIGASYVLSGGILFWSLWLPFRAVTSDAGALPQQPDLADQVEVRRTNAESIRAEALAIDREFMEMQRAKAAQRQRRKPGARETKHWWKDRIANTRKEIKLLGDPEPGTAQWHYKQDLIKSLQDGPL